MYLLRESFAIGLIAVILALPITLTVALVYLVNAHGMSTLRALQAFVVRSTGKIAIPATVIPIFLVPVPIEVPVRPIKLGS